MVVLLYFDMHMRGCHVQYFTMNFCNCLYFGTYCDVFDSVVFVIVCDFDSLYVVVVTYLCFGYLPQDQCTYDTVCVDHPKSFQPRRIRQT